VRDGVGLRLVKRVALWNFRLNLGFHRLRGQLRGEHVYRLAGDCRGCARCCEAPALRVWAWVAGLPQLRRLFLWWQQRVNGWAFVEEDCAAAVFVFHCSHFDPATRRCDSYDSRPGPCRDYPRLLLGQLRPDFLPGCGYRAQAPRAAQLRRALEARALPPATLARLRKELYLE
jgi:Fe-S-cluster containining protein